MRTAEIVVPKEPTFKLPEGRYIAIITSFKVKEVDTVRGKKENATILFEVDVPTLRNNECLARKVLPFELKAGTELRRFLTGLLGPDFFTSKSNQRIDLQKILVGMLCEVVLIHAKFDEEKYNFPLVDIEAVFPHTPEPIKQSEGTMTATE